jgi:hypothetical protein
MSVLKKRTEGVWHGPLAPVGPTGGRPPKAAANDNRDARAGRRRSILRAGGLLAAFGLGLAGALAVSGVVLGW